ncbi:MAG: hypothetical protein ACLS36_08415 [Streptococcus sp.]
MRTKDFIYYASAAVLLAVTTQVAQARRSGDTNAFLTEEISINLRQRLGFLVEKQPYL